MPEFTFTDLLPTGPDDTEYRRLDVAGVSGRQSFGRNFLEVLEYPELGMEAVWRIEVRDFPAFIIVDDKGNDFFADLSGPLLTVGRR